VLQTRYPTPRRVASLASSPTDSGPTVSLADL